MRSITPSRGFRRTLTATTTTRAHCFNELDQSSHIHEDPLIFAKSPTQGIAAHLSSWGQVLPPKMQSAVLLGLDLTLLTGERISRPTTNMSSTRPSVDSALRPPSSSFEKLRAPRGRVEAQHRRAQHEAGGHLADDLRLSEPAQQPAAGAGGHEDDDQLEEEGGR